MCVVVVVVCCGVCDDEKKKKRKRDVILWLSLPNSFRDYNLRDNIKMHFCPRCGNLLLVEDAGGMRFCCPTCPYVHNIKEKFVSHVSLKVKEVDDVLGGAAAWENVDRTETRCPFCDHNNAFFMQIQIRSADEPMTTFYRCVKCTRQWHD